MNSIGKGFCVCVGVRRSSVRWVVDRLILPARGSLISADAGLHDVVHRMRSVREEDAIHFVVLLCRVALSDSEGAHVS